MKERIHSIDVVRGLIMVIMTLDHTRDFLHLPGANPLDIANTTPILFFTRWITHYCAPTFVFLSGVSAYLAGQRRTKQELTAFLLKRGLWLIASDLLIISLLFTFDLQYHNLVLEVLWAIGFGMIMLALLIRAPTALIASLGLIIIFGHNLLGYLHLSQNGWLANITGMFLTGRPLFIPLTETRAIFVLYAAIPWSGALLLGYAFGTLYKAGFEARKRQRTLLLSGLTFVVLFIILRLINQYGDPAPWASQRNAVYTFLSFLNASKQTPSLIFICMTLGPIMILLALAERLNNKITGFLRVYGNVPYFYFIVHLFVLRVINVILIPILGLPLKSDGSPIVWQVVGFGVPLWQVYSLWIGVVAALYYVCRWYGNYKRTHRHWWLSYI